MKMGGSHHHIGPVKLILTPAVVAAKFMFWSHGRHQALTIYKASGHECRHPIHVYTMKEFWAMGGTKTYKLIGCVAMDGTNF